MNCCDKSLLSRYFKPRDAQPSPGGKPSITGLTDIPCSITRTHAVSAATHLSTRIISHPGEQLSTSAGTRSMIGGKGLFLETMRENGLPVPPFTCINTGTLRAFEQHPVDIQLLKAFIPDFEWPSGLSISLGDLKTCFNQLVTVEQEKTRYWLDGLQAFIASNEFYLQIKDLEAARSIRTRYQKLVPDTTTIKPVIVRSSGVTEDCYGDAQAGKYDSIVHGGHDDIVRTCLQVMASACKPENCLGGIPPTMGLIIQNYIDCRAGGVVMSQKSLDDPAMVVEWAPGQPESSVGGQAGITPHRYEVINNDKEFISAFTPGHVDRCINLKSVNGTLTTVYEPMTDSPDEQKKRFPEEMAEQLYQYCRQLENMLLCPVDVEFGIDQSGQLYLLQVRPVTRLTGSMNFMMAAPANPILRGIPISDGVVSGQVFMVNNRDELKRMPDNAIVFAEHGSDWMLSDDCLKRAGGFVFRQGSLNDHIAISLRQAGKPCLFAGEHYQWPAQSQQSQQPVTLVCGNFNNKPDAFLLSGDQVGKLHQGMDSSMIMDYPLLSHNDSVDINFTRVDSGFQWLNRQNTRLLNYFDPGRLLNRCLSAKQCLQLSIHPQKVIILQRLTDEINSLIDDSLALLAGYRCFLQMGNLGDPVIASQLSELIDLENQFDSIIGKLNAQLSSITIYFREGDELPRHWGDFRGWLENCRKLQNNLQLLHQPITADQVKSVHDLIYFIHQRFVKALPALAVSSGQGSIREKKKALFVEFISADGSGLLNDRCEEAIESLHCNSVTVVNMANAVIINIKLGTHFCVIEMLNDAPGGKGRTVRLKFSDKYEETPANHYRSGKFKRTLIIPLVLKSISVDEQAGGFDTCFNEAVPELVVQFTNITSTRAMQESLVKLLSGLDLLFDMDTRLNNSILDDGHSWSFSYLKTRLNEEQSSESNQFALAHALFLATGLSTSVLREAESSLLMDIFTTHLDNDYKEFFRCSWEIAKRPEKEIKSVLLNYEPSIANKVLYHLFLTKPEKTLPLIGHLNLFETKESVLALIRQNGEVIEFIPEYYKDDLDILLIAVRQDGLLLQHASDRLKNNLKLALTATGENPWATEYIGPELKNCKEIFLPAIEKNGTTIRYAGQSIRDKEPIALMALATEYWAYRYLPETLKNSREFNLKAVKQNKYVFSHIDKRYRKDESFCLSLVEHNWEILPLLDSRMKDNEKIVRAATEQEQSSLTVCQ